MTPQKKSPVPPRKEPCTKRPLRHFRGDERKGADNPYPSPYGNLFSLLSAMTETMALRLPKEEREAFLKKYKSKLFEVYGAVMKEYVTVPDALLKNTKEL